VPNQYAGRGVVGAVFYARTVGQTRRGRHYYMQANWRAPSMPRRGGTANTREHIWRSRAAFLQLPAGTRAPVGLSGENEASGRLIARNAIPLLT